MICPVATSRSGKPLRGCSDVTISSGRDTGNNRRRPQVRFGRRSAQGRPSAICRPSPVFETGLCLPVPGSSTHRAHIARDALPPMPTTCGSGADSKRWSKAPATTSFAIFHATGRSSSACSPATSTPQPTKSPRCTSTSNSRLDAALASPCEKELGRGRISAAESSRPIASTDFPTSGGSLIGKKTCTHAQVWLSDVTCWPSAAGYLAFENFPPMKLNVCRSWPEAFVDRFPKHHIRIEQPTHTLREVFF